MKHVYLAVLLLLVSHAEASVEVAAPIKVSTDVQSWTDAYSAKIQKMKADGALPATGYTECRETSEIPGAYLCQSDTQENMNASLGRASMFIEGLGDPQFKGKVIKLDHPGYAKYKRLIGGHDLRGEDLLRFHGSLTAACNTNHDIQLCPNANENEIFGNLIIPRASASPRFIVISFANKSSMSWSEVVTHEIMHAQYFNDPKFRQVCDDFWAGEMTESERAAIRGRLGAYYDAKDELLMRNEFQAYILMAGAEINMLFDFVPVYRARLFKKLNDAGVTPVQVK